MSARSPWMMEVQKIPEQFSDDPKNEHRDVRI
jgi:hypothetical protein